MTDEPEGMFPGAIIRPAPAPRAPGVAQPGPTLHAPYAPGGSLPEIDLDLMAMIEQARTLFRVARNPRGDAMWPHLRPHLIAARARLRAVVECDPGHPMASALLAEVERYLGHR